MKKLRHIIDGEVVPDFSQMTKIAPKDYSRLGLPTQEQAKNMPIHLVDSSGKLLQVIERRGGKRVGSGRKLIGREPMTIRLLPKAKKRLEALAGRKHCSLSEAVESLILQ